MEERVDRILPVGVSRTDWFFRSSFREKAEQHVQSTLAQMAPDLHGEDGKKRRIILYAPTFRGSVGHAKAPDRMDLVQMAEELREDYILLIKQHPFVKNRPAVPKEAADFAFDVSDRLPVEELMTAADICITDYSSIVFEYSLFEKPILFFAYDLEAYEQERGFYYPVQEMMPGPAAKDTRELVREIRQAERSFDLPRVREFKYRFMGGCDGHATARILHLCDEVRAGKKS